eukprot:12739618-Prorocentrum_lima.AAC.1
MCIRDSKGGGGNRRREVTRTSSEFSCLECGSKCTFIESPIIRTRAIKVHKKVLKSLGWWSVTAEGCVVNCFCAGGWQWTRVEVCGSSKPCFDFTAFESAHIDVW